MHSGHFNPEELRRRALDLILTDDRSGFWLWDLETDTRDYSDSWMRMIGFDDQHDVKGDPWMSHAVQHDRTFVEDALEACRGGRRPYVTLNYRMADRFGAVRHMVTHIVNDASMTGAPGLVAGVQYDVTEVSVLCHETGIRNLSAFRDAWDCAGSRGAFAVAFVCAKRIRSLAAGLSRSGVNAARVEIARRITEAAGRDVFMISETMFAFFVEEAGTDDFWDEALANSEAVVAASPRPLDAKEEGPIWVPLHVLALRSTDAPGADVDQALQWALHRDASIELRSGVYGADTMQSAPSNLIERERRLREAFAEDRLIPYFQPIVNLSDGQVYGLEALCRLRDEDGVVHSPAMFLDIARDVELMHDLGVRIRMKALSVVAAMNKRLRLNRQIYVAVNVDVTELDAPDFLSRLNETVQAAGVDPRHVVIELTESVFLGDVDRRLNVIEALRREGYQVAIDDFGAGYSSFGYLTRMEATILKIDKLFLDDLEKPGNASVLRVMRNLAADLDLTVVAEGVETSAQLDVLRRLGIGLAQGFHYARPMPVESDALQRMLIEGAI